MLIVPSVRSNQTILPRTIISFFNCDPRDVDRDGLLEKFKSLGVTHVTFQVFNSPGHSGAIEFEKWHSEWERLIGTSVEWCKKNGFRILGTGDEFFRTEQARTWIHNSPWAEQAVRYVANRLRETGLCDGIEMVDESKPPLAYGAEQFIAWWRDCGGPPLSWPNQGPTGWETPALSDYSSRYWPAWKSGELSLPTQARLIRDIAAPSLRPNCHWLCLNWCCGPIYQKRLEGEDYQEGDHKANDGVKPRDIMAQMWLALAYGASGVRIYGYDWEMWRNHRLSTPAGSIQELQTGSRPGDARWGHVEKALQTVSLHHKALARTPYVATQSGPWVFGRRGSLVWGVNTSSRAQPLPRGKGKAPSGEVIFWDTLGLIR